MSSVQCEIRGSAAWLTIDRPQAGNALQGQDVDTLAGQVRGCLRDPAVRVLVIRGSGTRFFCTGGDIRELAFGLPDIGAHIRKWHELAELIESAEKPVIAAINGHAVGGGLELALACHWRIAVSHARVGVPELKVGLFPSAGGVRRLTRLVGASAALGLVLGAGLMSAHEAQARGIVDAVCEEAAFEEQVETTLQTWCAHEPNAVRAVLACARTAAVGIDNVEMEIALLRECYQTPRNRERLQAFLEGLGSAQS
jgi:enoyl-CoA hydratase